MPNYPLYLSNLPESDRQHIAHCIETLQRFLKSCEGYLRSYEAENAEEMTSSVMKLLTIMTQTQVMIDEVEDVIIEKHGLPTEIKRLDDAIHKDFRELLAGRGH